MDEVAPGTRSMDQLLDSGAPVHLWLALSPEGGDFEQAAWQRLGPWTFRQGHRYVFRGGGITSSLESPRLRGSQGTAAFSVENPAALSLWFIIDPPPAVCPHAERRAEGRPCAAPSVVFSNNNVDAVYVLPRRPTTLHLGSPTRVTELLTYHWNDGNGTRQPGTLALRESGGALYGPWQASGRPGYGDAPNAYWVASPDVVIPAGTYTVEDSDPGTWANNELSQAAGIVELKGCVVPVGR